jgi:hypothetical protein
MGKRTRGDDLVGEFVGAELPDKRLLTRLLKVVGGLAADPAASFPKAAGSDGATEGTYRLLSNDRVDLDGILSGHRRETVARCREAKTVLVVHDTTEMEFRGESRSGLGRLREGKQGFLAHVALAVADDAHRTPLGVLGVKTVFRDEPAVRRRRRPSAWDYSKMAHKESARWNELAAASGEELRDVSTVHVMDREADSYALLSQMVARRQRFVVRLGKDRIVGLEAEELGIDGELFEPMKLREAVEYASLVLQRDVAVSRRRKQTAPIANKMHPPREGRAAKLGIHAITATLRRPQFLPKTHPEMLTLNLVRVRELDVSAGEQPIEWLLATTESIDDAKAVAHVVDQYRSRWIIEEYFKALKTGCAYEKRQLEERGPLLNALAIFIPIAWQLLVLRSHSRRDPDAPPSVALTPLEVRVLRHFSARKLPAKPTLRDVAWSIAAMGGHLKNNGEPGWMTLAAGLERLRNYVAGWQAALEM